MTTTDDDRTVETLRRLAHDEFPGARLDAELVLRTARRHRTTRRATGAASAGALALALAVGVPAAIGTHHAAPPVGATPTATTTVPAGTAQEPRNFGDAPVVRLTDDVQAVNVPTRLDSGPLRIEDLGGLVVTIADSGSGVDLVYDGSGTTVTRDDGTATTLPSDTGALTWTPGDHPEDFTTVDPYSIVTEWYDNPGRAGALAWYGGAVPSWLPGPRVLLYSSEGFDLPTGGSASVVELPTFRAPTADGRLLYLVVLRGTAADRIHSATTQVFFLGSDGSVFIPGCEDWGTVAQCEGQRGIPFQQILAEPVATFSSSSATASPDGAPSAPTSGAAGGPRSDETPEVPAPDPVVLGPGLAAATGLSSQAGTMADAGPYYLAGDMNGASVRLGTGTDPLPWYRVFAVTGEVVSANEASEHTLFERAAANSQATSFEDMRDGLFEAGVTPSGVTRAFYVAIGGFELADGQVHHAFEIPTFAPPAGAAGRLDPDQRMYLLAWARPATDILFDTTSGVVFATADGTIVDPACADQTAGQCAPYFEDSGAFAEVRALLAAG